MKDKVVIGIIVALLGTWIIWSIPPSFGQPVKFGKSKVYYTSSSNEADAKKLGEWLKANDYFDEYRGVAVQISKSGSTVQVRFCVLKDGWKKRVQGAAFAFLRDELEKKVFKDQTVEIHLCDKSFDTRKVIKKGHTEPKAKPKKQ